MAWLWLIVRLYAGYEWLLAGWWGLDRWVLVDLGTPWSPGSAFLGKPLLQTPTPTVEMKSSH